MDRVQRWNDLAQVLAIDSIRSSTAAGSGHPTSSLSAARAIPTVIVSSSAAAATIRGLHGLCFMIVPPFYSAWA